MRGKLVRSTVLLAAIAISCVPDKVEPPSLAGQWRAVLESPGGEMPFGLRFEQGDEDLAAWVVNGAEQVPVPRVVLGDEGLTLGFDHFDSVIEARLEGPATLRGVWTKTHHGGKKIRMPWRAKRGAAPRFDPVERAGSGAIRDVTGVWSARFTDPEETFPAQGEFRQTGDRVQGTFLTPTGDYRFLAGDYRDGVLRLSCFDGAHAFLFRAEAQDDGTLRGDFWSRNTYHATWTARRAEEGERVLPDPYAETTLTNPEGRLRFTFPDLDGNPVSLEDPRFAGKVVLVDIFGSWCPNCNDEAPLLADLYRRYRERGVEIVGLAFEMTGDPQRDRRFVRRYAERHGIEFPLLLAGTSDKSAASAVLSDLSAIRSFPTLVFIGRDGLVERIHTGFAGPGTGSHFTELKDDYVRLIEDLL